MKRTLNIEKNRKITFDDSKEIVFENIEAWKEEGKRRFGQDFNNWKYKCPMCGHIASVQDFIDLGVKDPANVAYEECIGRYKGKGSPNKNDSSGCNWAAYGLFGIPNGNGVFIMTGNEDGQEIFDFAPAH